MCSIGGWHGAGVSVSEKRTLLEYGQERGRDGFGAIYDGKYLRSLGFDQNIEQRMCLMAEECLFNFRAAPTTEMTGRREFLQPYDGIVHNGTVANCDDYGEFAIDSMCLPIIFKDREWSQIRDNCSKIEGGFALAYKNGRQVILAANYKPLYYYSTSTKFLFGSTPEMVGALRAVKMQPYSALMWEEGRIAVTALKKSKSEKRVLVACSSGLDSTTVAYMLKQQGYEVTLVHFLYGCNAEKVEMKRVSRLAVHGGFQLAAMELPSIFKGTIVSGKYGTDQKHGVRFADDWVSARNLLMLSTMTAYAETNGYNYLAYGGNLEESGGYPDNEQEFGRIFNLLLSYSVKEGYPLTLLQPLATKMKHEIVAIGNKVGVPWELTWSCYNGGEKPCGKCAPCYMRHIAFKRNNLTDPSI